MQNNLDSGPVSTAGLAKVNGSGSWMADRSQRCTRVVDIDIIESMEKWVKVMVLFRTAAGRGAKLQLTAARLRLRVYG